MDRKAKDRRHKDELINYAYKSYLEGKKYSEISRDKLPISGILVQHGVERYFGNTIELCKGAGIPPYEFANRYRVVKYNSNKIGNEDVDELIKSIHEGRARGMTKQEAKQNNRYYEILLASERMYGSWEVALHANQIQPHRITDEQIKGMVEDDVITYYSEHKSITRVADILKISFPLAKSILEDNGIKILDTSEWFNNKIPPLSKREVDEFLRGIIRDSEYNAWQASQLTKEYPHEVFSLRKYYTNISDAVMKSGGYLLNKRVPRKWCKSSLIRQIRMGYDRGEYLNQTYLTESGGGSAIAFARDEFGSWKSAVEAAGICYDEVSMCAINNADLGHRFESILDEILTKLGIEYDKRKEGDYHPDYILKNNVWMDAKLSEFTYTGRDKDGRTVIDKYEPHCDSLIIVFLIGDKQCDRKITEKTHLVNVNKYVEMLNKEDKDYFERELDEIKRSVNERAYMLRKDRYALISG